MSMPLPCLACLIPVACSVLCGAVAVAHEPEKVSPATEKIVVTGERVARTLKQTYSSVEVVGTKDLDRIPDTDRLDQLFDAVPNVVLGSGGLGPAIRGLDTTGVLRDLPAFLGGNRPRSTLVVDGRAVSYNEFVFGTQTLWDIARVEIFRGPQTTTQGRNSIAGAIFVETAAPESEWQGALRSIGGNYGTRQLSAMLTGPLGEGNTAFRISVDKRISRTSSELTSAAEGIDPNRDEHETLRVRLLSKPEALPGLNFDAAFSISSSQAPQIEGIRAPYSQRRDPRASYGVFRSSTEALTLRPSYDMGHGNRLSAVISVGSARVRRFAPIGLGEALNRVEDRSVEIIFNRKSAGLDLLLGASAARAHLNQRIDLSSLKLGIGTFRDLQESRGLFGEVRIPLADRFSVTAGARYQSDRQERTGGLVGQGISMPLSFDAKFTSFSPKLTLAYDAGPDASLGVLVQRGANPGGATLAPARGELDFFAAENLWNYELFVRGRLPQAGLDYSANLFHYAMRNAQRSVLRSIETPGGAFFLQEIGNVPRSFSRGAELSVHWRPAPRVALRGALGLLETQITRTAVDRDPLLGKEFQRSPHLTASLALNWAPVEQLAFDLRYGFRAGYFSDDTNNPIRRVASADRLDARIAWETGQMRLFGFVRNAFDSFDITNVSESGTLLTASDPREYGMGIQTRF